MPMSSYKALPGLGIADLDPACRHAVWLFISCLRQTANRLAGRWLVLRVCESPAESCFRQVGSHNRLLVFGFPPDRPRLLLLTHGACDLICQRFGEVADRCTTFRLEIGFDWHAWKELCPVDSLVDVSLVKGDFDRIKTFTGLSVETAISPHIEGVGSGGEKTCKNFRWLGQNLLYTEQYPFRYTSNHSKLVLLCIIRTPFNIAHLIDANRGQVIRATYLNSSHPVSNRRPRPASLSSLR